VYGCRSVCNDNRLHLLCAFAWLLRAAASQPAASYALRGSTGGQCNVEI
jgi:hypothetical protein